MEICGAGLDSSQDGKSHYLANSHSDLEQILRDNLILHREQLRHIPRAAHIPSLEPLLPLLRQADNRVTRHLRRVREHTVHLFRHTHRRTRLHRARVHREGHDALVAIFGVDALGEPEDGQFARRVSAEAGEE